jgi:hypothetical protein
MSADFSPNELVTVTLSPQVASGTAGNLQAYQYQFMVMGPMPGLMPFARLTTGAFGGGATNIAQKTGIEANPAVAKRAQGAKALVMTNGVSVPSDFPQIVITVNSNPSPGYLFLENALQNVPRYTMIVDNNGLPVWYRRGRMYDFKIQKNGMITWTLSDDSGFPAFDQNFNYLKTYVTGNGYLTDSHELKVQPDGTYFLMGYRDNAVDMSQYVVGGNSNAYVRETVVQEFTPEGDLILQWRAWDNYDIADENGDVDFPHMNGIDIDDDGNILVSARHLSEVTKVNGDTGEIMWRLSGAHSSFRFLNDSFNGTSFQHDISALGHGHYLVFDNGDYHTPQVSRAVEYLLDLTNMTATLVWQFRDTPDKYAYYLGSAQRLAGGNTLIDFVRPAYPKAIEVDTNGAKRFELSMKPSSDSYRAFRFPWSGVVAVPYLVVEPQVDNITLVFNKFGDRNVAYYRIYGGTTPHPTNVVEESATTLKPLYNLSNGPYYFRVTAVSRDGVESSFSNEETVNVNIVPPGANMVQNGNFSGGDISWHLSVNGVATAGWSAANGGAEINITNGGTSLSDVRLAHWNIPLIQTKRYVLDFDASASQSRYVQVELGQLFPPFLDYSHITPPFLTPNLKHFRYIFTMMQPSDFSANLLFNLGTVTGEVFLANVSLFTPPEGDLNLDGRVDFLDLGGFMQNWLRQQPALPGDLNGDGKVDFNDFGILSRNWSPSVP